MDDQTRGRVGRRTVLLRAGAVLAGAASAGCLGSREDHTVVVNTVPPSPTPEGGPKEMTPFDASEMEAFPDVEPFERAIHERTNEVRKQGGLDPLGDYPEVAPLDYHKELAYTARVHSRDMAVNDYVGHVNEEGEHAWNRAYEYGVTFPGRVGENVQSTAIETWQTPELQADDVVKSWVQSEEHRENLFQEMWDLEGVGVYIEESEEYEDSGGFLATQVFAQTNEEGTPTATTTRIVGAQGMSD